MKGVKHDQQKPARSTRKGKAMGPVCSKCGKFIGIGYKAMGPVCSKCGKFIGIGSYVSLDDGTVYCPPCNRVALNEECKSDQS
jgi:hypothetical protein